MDFSIIDLETQLGSPEEEAEEVDFTAIDLGPVGIVPPDAEFNTVRIMTQEMTCVNGIVTINRLLGEYVILHLQSDLSSLTINNWAVEPFFSRVMLDIYNEGNYSIAWPDWIVWSRNRIPEVTGGGNDLIVLTKARGVTVKGSIGGMDYSIL